MTAASPGVAHVKSYAYLVGVLAVIFACYLFVETKWKQFACLR